MIYRITIRHRFGHIFRNRKVYMSKEAYIKGRRYWNSHWLQDPTGVAELWIKGRWVIIDTWKLK